MLFLPCIASLLPLFESAGYAIIFLRYARVAFHIFTPELLFRHAAMPRFHAFAMICCHALCRLYCRHA